MCNSILITPYSACFRAFSDSLRCQKKISPSNRFQKFCLAILLSLPIINAITLLAINYFNRHPPLLPRPTLQSAFRENALLRSTGTFSHYLGTDGQPIARTRSDRNILPCVDLLHAIGCKINQSGICRARTTTTPPTFKTPGPYRITYNGPLGNGAFSISRNTIEDLMQSVKLSTRLPGATYKQLIACPMNSSRNEEAALLASEICHSEKVLSLVRHQVCPDGRSAPKYPTGVPSEENLDAQTPTILLSVAGAYFGSRYVQKRFINKNGTVNVPAFEAYCEKMWTAVFDGAVLQNVRTLNLLAIGLGAYVDMLPQAQQNQVAACYFRALNSVSEKYSTLIDVIYFNPGRFPQIATPHIFTNPKILLHGKDVFHLGELLASNGVICGLLNPANHAVVLGANDVGNAWQSQAGVAEELLPVLNTCVLGSRSLSDRAWRHPIYLS